jgi:hypothetical protein
MARPVVGAALMFTLFACGYVYVLCGMYIGLAFLFLGSTALLRR